LLFGFMNELMAPPTAAASGIPRSSEMRGFQQSEGNRF